MTPVLTREQIIQWAATLGVVCLLIIALIMITDDDSKRGE
jgi:hypothetical protein